MVLEGFPEEVSFGPGLENEERTATRDRAFQGDGAAGARPRGEDKLDVFQEQQKDIH